MFVFDIVMLGVMDGCVFVGWLCEMDLNFVVFLILGYVELVDESCCFFCKFFIMVELEYVV